MESSACSRLPSEPGRLVFPHSFFGFVEWHKGTSQGHCDSVSYMLMTIPFQPQLNGIGISPKKSVQVHIPIFVTLLSKLLLMPYFSLPVCAPSFILRLHLILKHLNERAYEVEWHLQWWTRNHFQEGCLNNIFSYTAHVFLHLLWSFLFKLLEFSVILCNLYCLSG